MEKRLILAVALSVVIYAGWMWLFRPALAPDAPPQPPASPTPLSAPEAPATAEAADAAPVASPTVHASEEERIEIDNGVFRAVLTNRGSRAISWKLLEFTTPDGQPLELFPSQADDGELPLAFGLDDEALAGAINAALFHVERQLEEHGERVSFTYSDGRGVEVRRTLVFRQASYVVEVDQLVRDRGRDLASRLVLGPGFGAQEAAGGHSNYYFHSQALWNVSGRVQRTAGRKLDDSGGFAGPLLWAGLEDQYFAALVVPAASPSQVQWRKSVVTPKDPSGDDKPDATELPLLSVSVPATGAQLFIGPKKYELLHGLGRELDKAIWFSSMEWLRPIVKYLFLALVWIHDRLVANWGWAIILATVALRLVLFPVNQYSMIAMKKSQLQMQRLQPKIKRIRERYAKKKDTAARAQMNQEMMDLYRAEGVNPMGGVTGCLPLLAQFPILIGFYNMLTVAVELRGAPFVGWIRDLSVQDPFWITPILMTATMFFQQRMAMTKTKDPQQLQQQRIMLFMPLMFGVICMQMPSGLVLYWFVNNLLGIAQQWLVNRHSGRLEAAIEKA